MLTDHRSENRVGVWEHLAEDSKGLVAKGRLLMEKQLAKDAYVDLKEGALDGLSIGFVTIADQIDRAKNARVLKEVDLREISLVSFPMLDSARITGVKTLADLSADDIREIEASFRMKGLSRTDAVKAVSGLKDWLARDASAPETALRDEGTAELAALIRRNTALLNT
jgi:HK97 family phage prohead protease